MRPRSTPTKRASLPILRALAAPLALMALAAAPHAVGAYDPDPLEQTSVKQARGIPPLVFVSRNRPTGMLDPCVPGFGLAGRTLAVGGRLLVRESGGRVRDLVKKGALYDVSDPSVSWDGTRIVFAGLAQADSAWRLYLVRADGTGLAPLTRSDRVLDLAPLGPGAAKRFERYDDFDPAWLPDGRIVFASTRFPQVSQEGNAPVSNLFVVRADGTGLERITSERNGGEEPTIDPTNGRIVYSRWLFNPYLPADVERSGLTMDRAKAVDHEKIDHWETVSIFPDGDRLELALGDPRRRSTLWTYQACVLPDGSMAAVAPSYMSPLVLPLHQGLAWYPRGLGPPVGEIRPRSIGSFWEKPFRGAASPAALPDGRIAFAADQQGIRAEIEPAAVHDDFGIYVVNRRSRRVERIIDLKGTDELDPAPLIARKVPPLIPAQGGIDDPAWTLPVTRLDQVRRGDDTFRFDCLNVFATGPVDSPFPDAPRIAQGARIRFFAALARPDAATGDTVVLVRESKIDKSGAVHESDIPGDVPMFEQLVDENGRVLMSAHGAAHVPGSNFARTGSGTKCIGCHTGHSALPVPKNNSEARWFNAAPSATVRVSSTAAGSAAALVDRRAKGPIADTGWVAESAEGQWARLAWAAAIEAHAIVLYAPSADGRAGTHLQVRGCQLVFFRDGLEVGRAIADRVRPEGTRVDFPPVRLDAVEVRPTRVTGTVDGRPAVALAEIETIARLIE